MAASPGSSTAALAPFVARHIGPREHEIREMLAVLGYDSLDALALDVVPQQIRLDQLLNLPEGVTEEAALAELQSIAAQNLVLKSYIGQGYYGTHTPKVIQRNVLENPAWYTAYTPYQPEISQGRLEILFYFQTMIAELTGLPISNASLLDEGTAAAEAMTLCQRSSKGNRTRFLVSRDCHPQTIDVVEGRAKPLQIEVVLFDENQPVTSWDGVFGVLLQYPGSSGQIRDDCRSPRSRCVRGHGDRSIGAYQIGFAGQFGGRCRGRQCSTVRCTLGIRRSPRRVYGHTRRIEANHAWAIGWSVDRSSWKARISLESADPRATHPPRESHVQYLYRPGTSGDHGHALCDVPRSGRPTPNCGSRSSSDRGSRCVVARCGIQTSGRQVLRHAND
jgi:hypothetical protein